MKIYLRHVKPLGFKGSGMFEDSAWHQTYYRVFYDLCVVIGIDSMEPGVWMVELTPEQMKRYKANQLSITPPGCCAPCAGEREVIEVESYIFQGPIKNQKHLKQILDNTGLWNGKFVSDKLKTAKLEHESLKTSIEELDQQVKDLQADLKHAQKRRYDLCNKLMAAKRRWNKVADAVV